MRLTPDLSVRVRVPATSANLGPGFDALGLALNQVDELVFTTTAGGLEIEVSGVGADAVPRDDNHLVVAAFDDALEEYGFARAGLHLAARNTIPHGRGLGSSAAAISAGVLAAAALSEASGGPARDAAALVRTAGRIEGHADNVAPCILGGVTIAWQGPEGDEAVRLDPHPRLQPLVFVPAATLSTKAARALQPDMVPLADAMFNLSRSALLVPALTSRPELLLAATEDRLHQGYRAPAMPGSAALIERLRAERIPAVVSGAGPSVLVLTASSDERLRAVDLATAIDDAPWTPLMVGVSTSGATVSLVP